MKYLIPILPILTCCLFSQAEAASFGIARGATPVLNSPAFGAVFGARDGATLKTDRCGQVRELEFIALPGTPFRLLAEIRGNDSVVYRVETDDYPTPAGGALYVASRFIEPMETQPPARARKAPAAADITSELKAAVGSPYVWGGNIREGISDPAGLFHRETIPAGRRERMILAGVDCSGLLYQASGGWTPRNTAQLVAFGNGVPIAGKNAYELVALLEPLDLIVWNGHVIVVLDRETVIESRLECGKAGNGGVRTTPLFKRLEEIMRSRRPADAWPAEGKQRGVFVVRRWIVP
ncbi:MAG: peptidoglycan endopeptidase [Deltaproteobacteria bacterium]|nr:peptidoglycan endopeptidase [Deltaproteobacteria bacterium]